MDTANLVWGLLFGALGSGLCSFLSLCCNLGCSSLFGGLLSRLHDCLLLDGLHAELNLHQRSVVALAVTHAGEAGVAALTLGIKRGSDDVEQGVQGVLVGDDASHGTASVHVATLCLGHELLNEGAQGLSLGLGRGERAVFNELSRKVLEDQLLVCRASAQTSTLLGGGHFVS